MFIKLFLLSLVMVSVNLFSQVSNYPKETKLRLSKIKNMYKTCSLSEDFKETLSSLVVLHDKQLLTLFESELTILTLNEPTYKEDIEGFYHFMEQELYSCDELNELGIMQTMRIANKKLIFVKYLEEVISKINLTKQSKTILITLIRLDFGLESSSAKPYIIIVLQAKRSYTEDMNEFYMYMKDNQDKNYVYFFNNQEFLNLKIIKAIINPDEEKTYTPYIDLTQEPKKREQYKPNLDKLF